MVLKKKRGVALISVLLILSFMLALTLGFVWYTMQDHMTSIAFHHSNICFYLAQAGQDYVLYLMKHNMMIFPSVPSSNNYADSAAAVAAGQPKNYQYMDAPYIGALDPDNNYRYTWVGREESLGPSRSASLSNSDPDDMNIGQDNEYPNNFDDWSVGGVGSDEYIDCTQIVRTNDSQKVVPTTYDANKYDTSTSKMTAGDLINVFNNNNKEFLLMSRLTLGDNNAVGVYLENEYACGTFRVSAQASTDTGNNKTILVTSTGMVKQVPRSQFNNDPETWDIEDENKFIVLSKRTVMTRIPYYAPTLIERGYAPDANNYMLDKGYMLTPERWFDRFR